MSAAEDDKGEQVENLLATPDLAGALESEQFRHFLDQIPIAIIVSELKSSERIVYVNPEFERLSGKTAAELEGKSWTALPGQATGDNAERSLAAAIVEESDGSAPFALNARNPSGGRDAYSNIIVDDNGKPPSAGGAVDVHAHGKEKLAELEERIREKDTLLREIHTASRTICR